jgi:hypothetical protein
MTSRHLRLKDMHPTMQKLEKIFAFADELGISIDFSERGPAIVRDSDRDKELPPLHLCDMDNDGYPMESFPPNLDFKVIYENPKFLSQEAEATKKRREKEEKERAEKAEQARLAQIRAEKEFRRNRISHLKFSLEKDRQELVRLEEENRND